MGVLNLFKTKKEDEKPEIKKEADKPVVKKEVKPKAEKKEKEVVKTEKQPKSSEAKDTKKEIKGKSKEAYRVLVKPLVTEKAADLGVLNKYAFVIDRSMNKIEVKKAIRAVYNVNPVSVRMINVEGKRVRQGRTEGKKKDWKKAIVTLREGEKIEVYEGV
jgi:large subunit ribosomal protein L23